jgi:glycosyltransferase involved in cell wall biosynthesis
MKILFLSHASPDPGAAGPGAAVISLARALGDQGVQVHLVAPETPVPIADAGVPLALFGDGGARARARPDDADALWRARLAVLGFLGSQFTTAVATRRQQGPLLLHAHGWFPSGLVGTWLSALANVPLVTTLYDSDFGLVERAPFARALFRHVVKHSARVTAVSQRLARATASWGGGREPLVAPVPVAGIETTPASTERERAHVVVLGADRSEAPLSHAVQAIALSRRGVTADVLVDGVPDGRAVAEAGQRVRWHAHGDRAALRERVRRAAALVVAGEADESDALIVEALLHETPVIVTGPAALSHVVQHDRTGIRAPADDANALASAIDELLGRADRGASLGSAGRMYTLATLAPESVARRYAALYRELLESSAP